MLCHLDNNLSGLESCTTLHTLMSLLWELLSYINQVKGCQPQRQLGRANMTQLFNRSDVIASRYAVSVVGSGEFKRINGVLVEIQDDCHPGKKDSCRSGFCCVKEVIAYRPEYKGEKAAYKLACKRMRREGEFCMPEDVLHICPCNKGFKCHTEEGMDYGHCKRLKKSINRSSKIGIGL